MKKTFLLLAIFSISRISIAQLVLSSNSYNQDFNDIGNGLPIGWSCYTHAKSDSLGIDVSATKYYETPVKWSVTYGEFRNSASANAFPFYGSADSLAQSAATDRSLAVRQVSASSSSFPGSDPGAAFTLKIANTVNLTAFHLSFKLQSLDSTSPRQSTWSVDYGFGDIPPVFTPASPVGILTTGGNTYSNNTITVDFGNALDNQSGPVWIRIVCLTATTGSGNRTTTGIDDYTLSWTGAASGIADVKTEFSSIRVLNANDQSISVGFSITNSTLVTASVYSLAGQELYSEKYHVASGENVISIPIDDLSSGMYFIEVKNKSASRVVKAVIGK